MSMEASSTENKRGITENQYHEYVNLSRRGTIATTIIENESLKMVKYDNPLSRVTMIHTSFFKLVMCLLNG